MATQLAEQVPTESERPVQHGFTKADVIACLALLAAVCGGWLLMPEAPDRFPQPPSSTAVRYRPLQLPAAGFAPLRLVGAWAVEAADPRVGGISALAIDGDALLALSDSGVLVRLPRPGSGKRRAGVRELPAGPGSPHFKRNRDSEALAADPAGRGWWVAFENRNQLWLFDRGFGAVLERAAIPPRGLTRNGGIEALAALGDGQLLLLSEDGQRALVARGGRIAVVRWRNRYGSLSAAARLPDGSLLLVARQVTLAGIGNRLLRLTVSGGQFETRPLARLPLGPLANVEALAAEPAAGGRTRLWLMTDNDFSYRRPTLLLALELDDAAPTKAGRD